MKLGTVTRIARVGCAAVPRVVRFTLARVMDVVELTVLWHPQSLALKRSHCSHTEHM